MSITLFVALALPVCTPSMDEPEWPVDLDAIAPVVDVVERPAWTPGLGGKTDGLDGRWGKCELDMFGLPSDLAPVVQRAAAACRKPPPPAEAAAAYGALYQALRAIPRRTFEVRSMQATVVIMWRNEVMALARALTRWTMRPTAKCIDPLP